MYKVCCIGMVNTWSLDRNHSVVFCCERFNIGLLPQEGTEPGT